MSMNVGSGSGSKNADPEPMMEMNMTPLIDVMLVLIIMLIITIPKQMHSVNLNMPVGNPPPPLVEPEVLRVDIDPSSRIFINGEIVDSRAALEERLRDESGKQPQPEVHVRPDRAAKYAVVAEVMATAQRLGMTKLGVVGSEQFIE